MAAIALTIVGLTMLFTSPVVMSETVRDRAGNPINSAAHGKFVQSEVERCKRELPKCHGLLITYRSGRCECRPSTK